VRKPSWPYDDAARGDERERGREGEILKKWAYTVQTSPRHLMPLGVIALEGLAKAP